MWEFGNNLNWDLVERKTYYARSTSADSDQFIPIPKITLAVNSYILLIGCRNAQAKSNWRFAGYAASRLLFSPSSTNEFAAVVQSYPKVTLSLDRLTIVKFSDFNLLPYILEIDLFKWHSQMFLEIWQYSGAVDDVENALTRIEGKIDAL